MVIVAGVALCFFWRLLRYVEVQEADLPGFVAFRAVSIRPPPSAPS